MAIAIAGAALGTAKLVSGLIKAGKAKKEAAKLAKERPVYNVNPNVQDELSLAQSELSNGMSAEATKGYEQGIDRDLSTTLDALLKGGGSPNNIAQTFDSSEIGRQKLAMMQDNLRLNQINNLVNAYRNQTNEEDKAFQFNEIAPYFDKTKANAEARKDASNLVWSGVDTIGSAGLGYLGGRRQERLYDKYFGHKDDPYLQKSTPIRTDTNPITQPNRLQMPNIDLSNWQNIPSPVATNPFFINSINTGF